MSSVALKAKTLVFGSDLKAEAGPDTSSDEVPFVTTSTSAGTSAPLLSFKACLANVKASPVAASPPKKGKSEKYNSYILLKPISLIAGYSNAFETVSCKI